jgi:hypothetical protein
MNGNDLNSETPQLSRHVNAIPQKAAFGHKVNHSNKIL